MKNMILALYKSIKLTRLFDLINDQLLNLISHTPTNVSNELIRVHYGSAYLINKLSFDIDNHLCKLCLTQFHTVKKRWFSIFSFSNSTKQVIFIICLSTYNSDY